MQLADAQQLAHLGSWMWDIPTNHVSWSDELYRIFGLNRQDFTATYEAYLDLLHPDDRHLVTGQVEQSLKEKTLYRTDHRIIRPDGTEAVIHAAANVILDEAGNPIRMLGAAQDITERKRAEGGCELARNDTASPVWRPRT